MTIERSALKEKSKSQIKGTIGTYFLCVLIIALISSATAPIFGAGLILTPIFGLSMNMIALHIVRNEKFEVKDTFAGFDLFGKALWLSIITNVFVFLWSLLLIVPGIIKAYSYSMAPYILAEHPEMTAREALNESKRMTDGYKGDLFLLQLSFFGWHILAMLTGGLLYIWLAPYLSAAQANYYLELKRIFESNATVSESVQGTEAGNNMYGDSARAQSEQYTTPLFPQKKKATMTGVSGAYTNAQIPVPSQGEMFVGTDANVCSLVIDTAVREVSRKHIGISFNPARGVYVVTDYSSNGTWANERRLPSGKPMDLQPGTLLKLANDKTMFLLD